MKVTDIKPIPKYMLEKIKKVDKEYYPTPDGHVRCYAYLTTWKNELVKVTVAVKHRYKKWYCKQVAVHGLDSEKCFVKDMEYCYCSGMGFRFGWYDEGLQKYEQWFERGWCWADDKYYDPYAELINPYFIDRLPEFKYSAYKLYQGYDIFKYLRLYRQYPQLEMLMKLGFTNIAMSTTILKRCGTDKAFCKWLIANQPLLQERHYYIDVIVRAYRTKKSLDLLQSYKEAKLKLIHDDDLKPIKELFKEKDLERFFDYMAKQQTNPNTYLDYLKACQHLGLDMTEEKNRFPHDFKRWNDANPESQENFLKFPRDAVADTGNLVILLSVHNNLLRRNGLIALQKIPKRKYRFPFIRAGKRLLVRDTRNASHGIGHIGVGNCEKFVFRFAVFPSNCLNFIERTKMTFQVKIYHTYLLQSVVF